MGHVLIGGGTGFIGRNLREILLREKYKVTVISRVKTGEEHIINWADIIHNGIPDNVNAVINLTGAPIMIPLKKFGYRFKKDIWISRVGSTMLLADIISQTQCKPNVFISVTNANMMYPSFGTWTEDYQPNSFMMEYNYFTSLGLYCERATEFLPIGVRKISIRTGTVLGHGGGFIKWLHHSTSMGLGATIGNGYQYQPWIHMSDLLNLILYSIENKKIHGILNGVSPEIATNGEITTTYAEISKNSVKFKIPNLVLRTLYGKERLELLSSNRQVIPFRTQEFGFQFKYSKIKNAMSHLLCY
ncbi:Domain of unknown function DUF1731,NAD(P)-binding domain,Epimerase family protein SDR39U1,NAD- [Cinara cedri]|uniref:NAD-dependent epimerase/dehydratase domain-containing protein n=1 Tax=Cinara cedri TaxID=506608 RepID=A0A5E4MVM1_9HEMI|nr:Domain of unknown function DUF1731,NAD(P)-binding domain,Epimerase family protein SDR39U1,NAD- [Cinara cedri]